MTVINSIALLWQGHPLYLIYCFLINFTDLKCPRRELWPEVSECAFTIYFLPFTWPQTSPSGTFADGQLTDALKNLATDPSADPKVRKKVLGVLASWSRQFKDDQSAAAIAGLYRQVKPAEPPRRSAGNREQAAEREREAEQKRNEKEAKRKAKEDRLRLEEEARKKKATARTTNTIRKPFDFEQVGFIIYAPVRELRLDSRWV